MEVAHEALIREWPALHDWLEADREGLRIHRQLTEMAQAWQKNSEDKSYLYRGSRLAQANDWAAEKVIELNALELAFLTACQEEAAAHEREKEEAQQRELDRIQQQEQAEAERRRGQVIRRALSWVVILLVLFVGMTIFAFVQLQLSSSRQLVIQAQSDASNNDFYKAALFATEANQGIEIDEATETAGDILPGTVPAQGLIDHTASVSSVGWSADGRLASGSFDGTVIV
jgi:hypothetical protein